MPHRTSGSAAQEYSNVRKGELTREKQRLLGEENMNKWVSLYGNFESRDESIIFNGQEFRNVTGEIQPLVGEILLEDKMLSGAKIHTFC